MEKKKNSGGRRSGRPGTEKAPRATSQITPQTVSRADSREIGPAEAMARVVRTETLIIGAGASGLRAAVAAAEHSRVVVVDGNDRVGKKLYATGNGRCNFTNALCRAEAYNAAEDGFVASVLSQCGTEETRSFFREAGMMDRREEGGRYYPHSGQASSVVRALQSEAERRGCRFLLSDRAVAVGSAPPEESPARFFAELESGRRIFCRQLIIACGGRAGLKTGSTGDGYGFARAFGHTLCPPRPALAAVESEESFLRGLKGVRAKGSVALCRGGRRIAEESGEIQFTGTGLSGICVFDLTRHMEGLASPSSGKKLKKAAEKKDVSDLRDCSAETQAEARRISEARASHTNLEKYCISCDFAPERREEELRDFLIYQTGRQGRSLTEALSGIVNDRLAEVLAELAEERTPPSGKAAARAAALLKELPVEVSHTKGWNDAQVTCGGVRREEIDPQTMESRLVKGLYFCGEVVDVDGRCGGYNLQWAWSSGAVAGMMKGER